MDAKRVEFLFGPALAARLEPDDLETETQRLALVGEHMPPAPHEESEGYAEAVYGVVANQILDDDPPMMWETVERLQGRGVDRDDILRQLFTVVAASISAAMEGQPFDAETVEAALAELPLPTASDVAVAIIEAIRRQPGGSIAEVTAAVSASFPESGRDAVDEMADRVLDAMMAGPVAIFVPDVLYASADLIDGRTFTHRLTDVEVETGELDVGFDLGFLRRFTVHRLGDVALEKSSRGHGQLLLRGESGWLSGFAAGDVLSITTRVDAPDGGASDLFVADLTIDRVDEPSMSNELTTAVRAAYDEWVAEPWLPVDGDELATWLCAYRAELLDDVPPPLADICAEAGLERRGGVVAHEQSVWAADLERRRFHEVASMVESPDDRRLLARTVELLDDPAASPDDVAAALADCHDAELVGILADVIVVHGLDPADESGPDGPDEPAHVFHLVRRALEAARRSKERAAAEFLATVLWERAGDPIRAEQHLIRANDAGSGLGPAIERMGWYRYDRGDARGAMKWWRELEEIPTSAEAIEEFLAPGDRPKIGRNDPCWCGSGRKFKQCHQQSVDVPALPDRVKWLSAKSAAWIDHAHPDVRKTVVDLGAARASGRSDVVLDDLLDEMEPEELGAMFEDAFGDPIVLDAALHEGGWFDVFVHERSALLPDDEQLLVAAWQTAERSVHEVVGCEHGASLTLRDLATGDVTEVRERTLSKTAREGELYCARVVSDGAGSQILGGVFPVRAGFEQSVLGLCEHRDAAELCAWVGRLFSPPRLERQEGMIDSMFDFDQLQTMVESLGDDADPAKIDAVMREEFRRQAMARWLDEEVPALGGVTPREAAADPTRRDQLERLLGEIRRNDERIAEAGLEPNLVQYDVDALRRELGLD